MPLDTVRAYLKGVKNIIDGVLYILFKMNADEVALAKEQAHNHGAKSAFGAFTMMAIDLDGGGGGVAVSCCLTPSRVHLLSYVCPSTGYRRGCNSGETRFSPLRALQHFHMVQCRTIY
jgi:hypothetical protein